MSLESISSDIECKGGEEDVDEIFSFCSKKNNFDQNVKIKEICSFTKTDYYDEDNNSSECSSILEPSYYHGFGFSLPNVMSKLTKAKKKIKNQLRKNNSQSKFNRDEKENDVSYSFDDGESVESLLIKFRNLRIEPKNIKSLRNVKEKTEKEKFGRSKSALNNSYTVNSHSKRVVLNKHDSNDEHEYSYKPSLISKSLILLSNAFD